MFQRTDDGFSLVEVLIAMFLFAVISLAVLPLLITGIQLSTVNRDVVAATSVANERIAQLREQFPTSATSVKKCNALLTAVAAISPTDARNPRLTISAAALPEKVPVGTPTPAVCPVGAANYPRSIRVTVTVREAGGATTTVPTRITVGAAS